MESFTEAWNLICEYCKTRITEVAYTTWISRIVPVNLDFTQGVAILEVPNEFHLQTINRCYATLLKEAFEQVFGSGIEIRLCTPDQIERPEEKSGQPAEPENKGGEDYEYTFDTFIVGSSNKFAHAASMAVATKPAVLYNPLFIYGNSGLGKTHLLYAIENEIQKRHPEMNIIYIKGEEFTNELIEAIRRGTTVEFRQKYRKADVLLVDDIQFIAGKDSTQEEFFHTFNTLHSARKQIILSSDRPPKDMDILEERIRSRFEWGLMADIQSPDYETRMAILRKKQEMDGYDVGNDVIEYIAQNVKSNIRELEGSLNKVIALANLEKREINLELAEKALIDIISPNEKKIITPDYIINTVAEHFDITPDDIKGDKRSSKIAHPRQIAMYLCREMTGMNLQRIGEYMGGKDHTTIMYGIRKIESQIKSSDSIKNTIQLLKKKINPSG